MRKPSPAKQKTVAAKAVQKADPKRSFKTGWFEKAAKKAGITDVELCDAIKEAMVGQAEDLGGGVWKKRLNKNMDRSIILAKGGTSWIYVYLFSKSDRANIDDDELKEFKKLATHYGRITNDQLNALVMARELTEICNDSDHKKTT
jgi:hypothetical protein